jgi:hypothetical protein
MHGIQPSTNSLWRRVLFPFELPDVGNLGVNVVVLGSVSLQYVGSLMSGYGRILVARNDCFVDTEHKSGRFTRWAALKKLDRRLWVVPSTNERQLHGGALQRSALRR